MYDLSIYTMAFRQDGKCYIYNSRSNFFSEISEELYGALNDQDWQALPNEVVEELLQREIILKKEDKYDYFYSRKIQFNTGCYDSAVLNLVIAPTTACNFACPYCFESKTNPKTIDDCTINKLVDFVKGQTNAKSLNITWYGGEPLLAFDKIKKIYNLLSEENMPAISWQAIVTNGYCFNDEVITFFKENGCRFIQITIDGLYEKNDATRCLKCNENGTFNVIIKNIDRLVQRLPDTDINIRVNINKINYKELVAVTNFFKDRYPGNKRIGVYPCIIRQENKDMRSMCSSAFVESEMLSLNNLLRKEGFRVSDFPNKKTRGCMMHDTNSFLIGPEGEIYKCWNDIGRAETVIGNIADKALKNESRYIKYTVQATPFNDECKNCHAFPICDGGCSHYRYRNMFEGCHFDLCSPYKDKEKLKKALLSGEFEV